MSKRNLIRKKIEELKGSREPEESFNPVELEQAFGRAYRSYRINSLMYESKLFATIA